jgi:hypothetical protein
MPIRSWIASIGGVRPQGLPVRFAGSVRNKKIRRRDLFLLGSVFWWLLLWAAWAVRLWHLDASDLTFDEAATYVVAHRPLLDILPYLRGAVREHPPVYYLLVRPWMSLTGTSEYSLRFFAAGASLVGIALAVRLARALARETGIVEASQVFLSASLPALILALFPFEVYYARDARMYTLTIVWATLSSLLFLSLLFGQKREERPNRCKLLGLVIVNALAVFTHYYLVLLVVTQFVTLLLLRRWRALVAWSTAHGVVLLVGLVWLARSPGLASSLAEAWGRFDPVWPATNQLRRLLADLLFGPVRGVPWNLVYGWGILVVLGFLAVWLRSVRANGSSRRRRAQASGVWLNITVLLPIALSYLMPEPPRSRYLIFILPFAAIALGQIPFVLNGRKQIVLVWLGLSAWAVANLGYFGLPRTVNWLKSNYGQTVATVSAHARPGDGVLFYGPWQKITFQYYSPPHFPPITSLPPHAPPQLVPEEAEPVLRELLNTYQRLWVIPAAVEDVDPKHFVAGWLNTHAHPMWTSDYLSLYEPPPQREAVVLPTELTFGDRLRLKQVTGDAPAVPAGESLRLTLTWVVSDTLDGDVKLDFSLKDEEGKRWLQWYNVPGRWSRSPSAWKAGDVITDRQGVIVPQGAPPGRYTLQLAVVDADSGEPLWPTDANAPLSQVVVDLLSFEVVEPVSPPVLTDVGDFVGPFQFEPPRGASDMLTLAGYELGGLKFTQGNPVSVRLHWLASAEPAADVTLRLQLLHRTRRGLVERQTTALVTETLPLAPGYPVTEWPSGRLVSLPIALSIPSDVTSGSADLTLSVLGSDGQPWTIGGSQYLTLGTMTIEARPVMKRLPVDLTAVEVDFADAVDGTGDQIGLRGYRIDGEAQPGGRLELTYGWQALSRPTRIYSVFNHLLTADGQRVTQADGWPQDGVVLTNQWRQGEYIRDSHTLEIPANSPPGPYILVMGLYNAANGERLQAFLGGQPLPNNQWQMLISDGQGE